MCLKFVKQYFGQKRSIAARLIILYSLSTVILLSIVTWFLYWGMGFILFNAGQQLLLDEINTVDNFLHTKPLNINALKQEVAMPEYLHGDPVYRYYIRVLSQDGKLLVETSGFSRLLQHAAYFKQIPNEENASVAWRSPQGKSYLLMQGKAQGKPYWIQIALDISHQKALANKYYYGLLLTLIGSALLAILLSILITKRGLGHLKKLTAATEKITVSNLHERIDPTALPQELISLGIAFNQMLARIEASFSALSAFSAELAHEIRTPINNLMGSTEVMLSGNYTVKEYQDELVSNFEELQRIAQILENLLFLARAENGLIDLEKATLNVSDEIKALIAYHQAMADEKEIAMVCYGEAELKANSVMFKRMISNILSNALKYAYNQSKISIEIKKLTQQQTQIIINNQGIGIAAAHLPKLFERFYRIKDSESANKKEGLGLGLAIVKTIVDLHQGNIVIHSQPGQNVSVIITLPG